MPPNASAGKNLTMRTALHRRRHNLARRHAAGDDGNPALVAPCDDLLAVAGCGQKLRAALRGLFTGLPRGALRAYEHVRTLLLHRGDGRGLVVPNGR